MKRGKKAVRSGDVVKREMAKQIAVIALIAALGIWQHHFVVQVASSDIYLFVLLFGAGIFGIYNAIHGTYRLGNEFLALEAMKEVHEDALWHERDPDKLAEALAHRSRQKAVVYYPPSALGTAHNLLVEEMRRSGQVRISTGTMQVLVNDLEAKLDHRQGMTHYLSALMVLLGLLGTFIGLMHTLESVGGILGSIDVSGSGGAGAIGKLIESLKMPLEGMSTGFGASLFGLVGSLIIGFLGKIDTKAAHALKHEFETWIRSTVQIEAANRVRASGGARKEATAAAAHVRAADPEQPRLMLKVARLTVANMAQLTQQVAELGKTLDETRRELAGQRADTRMLTKVSLATATAQGTLVGQLGDIAAALEALGAQSQSVGTKVVAALDQHARTANVTTDRLVGEIRAMREEATATMRGLGDVRAQLEMFDSTVATLSDEVRRGFTATSTDTARAADDSTGALLADLDHMLAASRLGPGDVKALRRLSALVTTPKAEGGLGDLTARLEARWRRERGAAPAAAQALDTVTAPAAVAERERIA